MGINVDIKPTVNPFFDKTTHTFSYVVRDPTSNACAIIDPVLNFDYASGSVSYQSANCIIDFVNKHQLMVVWIIETHVHADHLTAAPYLKKSLGGKIAIGTHITQVQESLAMIFNEDADFKRDGSQFDHLFFDGEKYKVGNIPCKAIHTPGHTPTCMSHQLGDACFVGDTLFMPDVGTARVDFPGGNAGTLYDSIKKIFSLPQSTRIYLCHDYCPKDRNLEFLTTVNEQLSNNIHVKKGIAKDDFINMRQMQDQTLAIPTLFLPSLLINLRAGYFPEPEANGRVYLKVPLNAFI